MLNYDEIPSPRWYQWHVRKNFAAKYYPDKNINYFCTGEDIGGDEIDCREKEFNTIKCFASPKDAMLYLFKYYHSEEEGLGIDKIFVEQDNGEFIEVYKIQFSCVGPTPIFSHGYQWDAFREYV
jgi:hypothetical protein